LVSLPVCPGPKPTGGVEPLVRGLGESIGENRAGGVTGGYYEGDEDGGRRRWARTETSPEVAFGSPLDEGLLEVTVGRGSPNTKAVIPGEGA